MTLAGSGEAETDNEGPRPCGTREYMGRESGQGPQTEGILAREAVGKNLHAESVLQI